MSFQFDTPVREAQLRSACYRLRVWGKSHRYFCLGAIVVVRWSPAITVAEVRSAVSAILTARRSTHRAVALVVEVPPTIDLPPAAVLDEFAHHAPFVAKAICTAIGVMPPGTAKGRLIEGSWVAYSALTGRPAELCASLEEGLRRAAVFAGDEPDHVLAAAMREGLLEGNVAAGE